MDEQLGLEKGKLMKTIRLFIIVLSAVFVALFFLVLQWYKVTAGIPVDRSTISVTGVAEKFVVPDIARLHFSVQEEALSVAQAQEAATELINNVTEYLDDNDVDEKDIKTTYYNIQPKYEYSYELNGVRCRADFCPPPYKHKQNLIGYEVNQSTEVKIRDLEDAGTIVAGLGELGVQNVSGLSFEIDDREAVVEEVKKEAILNGRAKAKERAKALGVRLGKILSFSEDGYYPQPYFEGRGGGADIAFLESTPKAEALPAPTILPGENRVTSQINIVYEIK